MELLNVKKTLTKILDASKIETDTVSASGTLSINANKRYGIVTISCTNGNVTASANASIGTIPSGFRPAIKVEVTPSAGGNAQRLTIDTDGNITTSTSLSNAGLRFSATFVGDTL